MLSVAGLYFGFAGGILDGGNSVLAQTSPPNPALKEVVHDSTLSGNGTAEAPLSVVGQGGSAQFVDSSNHVLGPYERDISGNTAIMRINSFHFIVPVNQQGFADRPGQGPLFASSDCSGPGFFFRPAESDLLVIGPLFSNNYVAYGSGFPQNFAPLSIHRSLPVVPGGPDCEPFFGPARDFYPMTVVDLSTLGFVPPFHIEIQ